MTTNALRFVSSSQALSDNNCEPDIFRGFFNDAVSLVNSGLATYSIYASAPARPLNLKQQRAASLINSWLADPTDHDEKAYPNLQKNLKTGAMRCRED